MSYERVSKIRIDLIDKKVFITSHSNNDTAKPHEWECVTISNIFQKDGLQKAELEIFKGFEEGTFQSSQNNKFTRALKVMRYMFKEEYERFNWRNNNESYRQLRESKEFDDFLLKVLNTKLPKAKFVLEKNINNWDMKPQIFYCWKVTSRRMKYTDDINLAKRFNFREEAEQLLHSFRIINGQVREVEK